MNTALRPLAARVHHMPFGAEVRPEGVRFRVWAPQHERMRLRLIGREQLLRLEPDGAGWHALLTHEASAGTRYQFVLPDGVAVPDPASRYQPDDVHGPSEIIDAAAHAWTDLHWRGRPWEEAVLYELHVGCFTAEGTYRAAAGRLTHLAQLGVTAVELMPLSDFPGRFNWGYDGVLPFAPDASYGHPDELKAFIEAAHARGIMVLLDVVYNHFGPEGNYLGLYAPQFFSTRHQTPWGAALNFDGRHSRPVREFVIHNALYWLGEFHCDGLRLDAVHAILDDSPRHLLAELADRVRDEFPDRHIHLVLENEHNEARWFERDRSARVQHFTAQWNDDAHHVLHVAATGENEAYYAEYAGRTDWLGRALAEGFAFQGESMSYRGSSRGTPSADLPPGAFIAFVQNHDQVGNRALGERIGLLADAAAVRAVTATYLLLPQIPMLFMGEEWQAREPFLFFCDFEPSLGQAVVRGRRAEFARFAAFSDETARARIPDPQATSTFLASKLDWSALEEPHSALTLEWYRELLGVRRRHIVPLLADLRCGGRFEVIEPGAVRVHWQSTRGMELTLLANLKASGVDAPLTPGGRLLWQEGLCSTDHLAPWTVRWSLRT
jgi:malto-oligosyltrehalose trehalohydrolase